jgi:hypothetical protein
MRSASGERIYVKGIFNVKNGDAVFLLSLARLIYQHCKYITN